MNLYELIVESTGTARLDITATNAVVMQKERVFFEAFAKTKWPKVLSNPKMLAEATCELRDDECFIGHIQAYEEGKGYGSELLNYILQYYKAGNIHKFSAYINNQNAGSRGMFTKAGFTESTKKNNGSFWTMTK